MAKSSDISSNDFANFSFTPPRPTGRLRSFSRSHRSKYYANYISPKDKFGSNTSLTSYGSTQDLTLDSTKQMDMCENAKSRKISAEVMKHRLYESVITSPRRRRFSHRSDGWSGDGGFYGMARMAQSLPVTPAMTPAVTPGHSQNTSPSHSPRGSRQFLFGFFSRGHTPDNDDRMLLEENGTKGLASILKPHPKYISASNLHEESNGEEPMQTDDIDGKLNLSFPPPEVPSFINRLAGGDRDSWFHKHTKQAQPSTSSMQLPYPPKVKDATLPPTTSF